MSGKRWSSDKRSDQSEARLDHVTSVFDCLAVDVGGQKTQDLFLRG